MTVPSGNGEARGPESAGTAPANRGTTRPERAAANNARNKGFLGSGPPKDQGGFGTEDMQHDADHLSTANEFFSKHFVSYHPLDLNDAGHVYGGS